MGTDLKRTVFIGYDEREADACHVAMSSLRRRSAGGFTVHLISMRAVAKEYRRPTELRDGRLWDVISQAPMSTSHAIARFFVPKLAQTGWAIFMDGDVLVRADVNDLFDSLDPGKALYCVHHDHRPASDRKMDGQIQTAYARKNWSSVVAFNCDHPANRALTLQLLNTAPGRDLHRFCWLDDSDIGSLDPAWNWLVGHSDPAIDPKIVHFTDGVPDMPGYERCAFADEWRAELMRIAA
jgi:lipopolysaccharide biosynthesis glycosyltransferase